MFKYRSNISTLYISMIPVILTAILFGCGSKKDQHLGAAIPRDAQTVKLETILANPTDFNGKKVVMKGIISGQCPSLCEFFYKEGVHKTTIYPQGYSFSKLKTGNEVTVYAEVTAGKGNIVFSALGVQVNKGS